MDGRIKGLPTMMLIYGVRLEAADVLAKAGATGYPLHDVSVYYRLKDTDQVLDATTGQIAAGQSLTDDELKSVNISQVSTVVLLHPPAGHAQTMRDALLTLGPAEVMYSEETDAVGQAAPGIR